MADREPLLLAADIGATKTALGLFAPAGRPLAQQTVHNSGFASFDDLVAGLPIALGFLDFKRKRAGVERLFEVTGDIEADMVKIQAFYAHITGKNPRQF